MKRPHSLFCFEEALCWFLCLVFGPASLDSAAGRQFRFGKRQWAIVPGLVILSLGWAEPVAFGAHPFHISVAEMEFNAKSKRIEVSLKLHAADLENVLSARLGKRVNVEEEKLDKAIEGYLAGHFYLVPEAAAKAEEITKETPRSTLSWVGSEMENSWIWLYFELQPPRTEAPLGLVNTVLLDRVEDQINTVTVRVGRERKALKMNLKTPWLPYSRDWFKGSNGPSGPMNSKKTD